MMSNSSPSIFTSVPDHLPNKILSPDFNSIGINLPASSLAPAGARDDAGKLIPMELKSGDKILFGKWSGTEVKIDGEELLIMKESDILGIIS